MKPVEHDEYDPDCRCIECVGQRIAIWQRPAETMFDDTDNDND